jgi:hypothetical protein
VNFTHAQKWVGAGQRRLQLDAVAITEHPADGGARALRGGRYGSPSKPGRPAGFRHNDVCLVLLLDNPMAPVKHG